MEILPKSEIIEGDLVQQVKDFVMANVHVFENGPIHIFGPLTQVISKIAVVDLTMGSSISFWAATLSVHVYRLSNSGPKVDFIEQDGSGDLPAYKEWELPNISFEGLWESIIVDEKIKNVLFKLLYNLHYILLGERGRQNYTVAAHVAIKWPTRHR